MSRKQTHPDPLGYLFVRLSLLQQVLELFCGIQLPFTLAICYFRSELVKNNFKKKHLNVHTRQWSIIELALFVYLCWIFLLQLLLAVSLLQLLSGEPLLKVLFGVFPLQLHLGASFLKVLSGASLLQLLSGRSLLKVFSGAFFLQLCSGASLLRLAPSSILKASSPPVSEPELAASPSAALHPGGVPGWF